MRVRTGQNILDYGDLFDWFGIKLVKTVLMHLKKNSPLKSSEKKQKKHSFSLKKGLLFEGISVRTVDFYSFVNRLVDGFQVKFMFFDIDGIYSFENEFLSSVGISEIGILVV